jgi:lipopolysaccharide/colanic/teichoic acid biosynthesis glycosyltransferase
VAGERPQNNISNFDEVVRLDLNYIDNWSLWLDIKILLRTLRIVFQGTGRCCRSTKMPIPVDPWETPENI